jgi:uncharacterized OB-fold protein
MDINRVEPISIEGKICIPYRWPTGSTTGFFLTKLKEQKQIYGIKCPKCNSVTVPPRQKCLQCKTISKEWIKVGPGGSLQTWTVSNNKIFGLILLGDFTQLKPGSRVKAIFSKERKAQITDIQGFQLLG